MVAEATFRLSVLAEADLEEIWSYTVDNWSWEQAEIYHGEILNALQALASGRRNGRKADIRDGYFKYPIGAHFVFYRRAESGIDVVRILHQRMDISLHL